jgi:hypothetical protein
MSTGQDQRERDWLMQQRHLFDAEHCEAWRDLRQMIAPKISFEELRSLAIICHENLDIELSRDVKRRKEMLIKWFDDHWVVVKSFLQTRVSIRSVTGKELNTSFVPRSCLSISGNTQEKTGVNN